MTHAPSRRPGARRPAPARLLPSAALLLALAAGGALPARAQAPTGPAETPAEMPAEMPPVPGLPGSSAPT